MVLEFLAREFGNNTTQLRIFYGYLVNKVKLIRIQTKDVAKALKIFETINDRGVGLDSMDLLKNLLFMKANRDDFEKLKVHWKELQDTIFDMGERPASVPALLYPQPVRRRRSARGRNLWLVR